MLSSGVRPDQRVVRWAVDAPDELLLWLSFSPDRGRLVFGAGSNPVDGLLYVRPMTQLGCS